METISGQSGTGVVATVISHAQATFGSYEKAVLWLNRPTSALDGATPLSLLDSADGIARVEALLTAIDHGSAA